MATAVWIGLTSSPKHSDVQADAANRDEADMQSAAWFSDAIGQLRAVLAVIFSQLADWSDRVYGDGYGPLAETALFIAAGAAMALCLFAWFDERDVELWSSPTIVGRWMGVIVGFAVMLALEVGRHIAA